MNLSRLTLKDRIQWWTHVLFRCFPIPLASGLGGLLGGFVMLWHTRTNPKWVRRFRKNYNLLCEGGDSKSADACLISLGNNIGRCYAEYAVNEKFCGSGYLRFEGLEHLQGLPHPPILLTAHLGNFELAASCLAFNGSPVSTISDLNLESMDQCIAIASRKRCFAHAPGGRMIKAGPSTMRHVLEDMARGQVVVIYCDEFTGGMVWGPSLGREIPLRGNRILLAKLALKFQAPIVPAYIRRERGCRLVSVVESPLFLPGSDDCGIEELARRIDGKIETWVRSSFDQWYWAPRLDMSRTFS
jgi:KDO2-lipid IV(A) lauroyltransferase